MTGDRRKQIDRIGRGAARKEAMRRDPGPSPLRGIGVFGAIGWAVAVPTVGGAFLGMWLDRTYPGDFAWTIALILGGVAVGGLIAWNWIDREKGG